MIDGYNYYQLYDKKNKSEEEAQRGKMDGENRILGNNAG